MEWANLILNVLGTGVVASIITFVSFFIYRKQNKKIKDNEAKGTDLAIEEKELELDRKQIDLGNEFMKSSLEMTRKMQEMMTQNQQSNENNWKVMFSRMDVLENTVVNIKTYLNGGFAEFEEQLSHQK